MIDVILENAINARKEVKASLMGLLFLNVKRSNQDKWLSMISMISFLAYV